jgi:hypothetical protein
MGDQPHPDTTDLSVPFVVVKSRGGMYDDTAFSAGVDTGRIDAHLETLARLGARQSGVYTVRTVLRPQLELVAMRHGFHHVGVSLTDNPNWAHVQFAVSAADVAPRLPMFPDPAE